MLIQFASFKFPFFIFSQRPLLNYIFERGCPDSCRASIIDLFCVVRGQEFVIPRIVQVKELSRHNSCQHALGLLIGAVDLLDSVRHELHVQGNLMVHERLV